jgi:hypothetical protein
MDQTARIEGENCCTSWERLWSHNSGTHVAQWRSGACEGLETPYYRINNQE